MAQGVGSRPTICRERLPFCFPQCTPHVNAFIECDRLERLQFDYGHVRSGLLDPIGWLLATGACATALKPA